MKRKLKWKRAGAGLYRSGDLEISGSGTNWGLRRVSTDEVLAEGLRSKKLAQEEAETEPTAAPRAKSISGSSIPEFEGTLRGALLSIERNASTQGLTLLELRGEIAFLRKAVEQLTVAILQLGGNDD